MNKKEFLSAVKRKITELPKNDIKRSLEYYEEMIADYMEDGMTEAEAVASVGTADEVAEQILADNPIPPKTKRKLETWEIVLLCVSAPIWISLLAAAGVIWLSLYITVWAVIIVLYAVFVSFVAVAVAGIVGFVAMIISGHGVQGVFLLGAGLMLAGLSVFMLMLSNFLTSMFLKLHKTVYLKMKK